MTKYEDLFEQEILRQLDDCEAYEARLHLLEQEIKDQRTSNETRSNTLQNVLQRLRRSISCNPMPGICRSLPEQLFLEPGTEQADETADELIQVG